MSGHALTQNTHPCQLGSARRCASGDGEDVAEPVRKRLVTIGKAKAFVDWRKIKLLAHDIHMQRRAVDRLGDANIGGGRCSVGHHACPSAFGSRLSKSVARRRGKGNLSATPTNTPSVASAARIGARPATTGHVGDSFRW
ncbi:DUF6880 family protein [Sphingobium sp.]|uniref:DUF6880 family protein n=1 Tax=Sphingobium sp. TaxID=1912891 RepID=UPI00338EC182